MSPALQLRSRVEAPGERPLGVDRLEGSGGIEVIVKRPAALDVHNASVTACVRLPGKGRRRIEHLAEFQTTTQGLLALRDWLEAHAVDKVAMEATGVYWKPVWAVLEERFECLVVNARHVKQVPGRELAARRREAARLGRSWEAVYDRKARGWEAAERARRAAEEARRAAEEARRAAEARAAERDRRAMIRDHAAVARELADLRRQLRRYDRELQVAARARVLPDGTAVAPRDAPEVVKEVIRYAKPLRALLRWSGPRLTLGSQRLFLTPCRSSQRPSRMLPRTIRSIGRTPRPRAAVCSRPRPTPSGRRASR